MGRRGVWQAGGVLGVEVRRQRLQIHVCSVPEQAPYQSLLVQTGAGV